MSETLFKVCCPSCETVFEVTDSALVGQIVACPKCGGMILIEERTSPSAEAEHVQEQLSLEDAPSSEEQSFSDVADEVEAPPVISDHLTLPPLPDVDEYDDADERFDVGAPQKSLWRTRLILVLAGAICALLVASAVSFLSRPDANNMPESESEQEALNEEVVVEQQDPAEDVQGEEEPFENDPEEEIVFTRNDSIELTEEFDARYAVELSDDESADVSDEETPVLNGETADGDISVSEESEEPAVDEEVGEFVDDVADDEEELPESDAIATEFDEEEFEKANVGVEDAQDAEDEEEDLGAVASTTNLSLQSSLPTLRQAPKDVDVEGRMKLRISSIEFPESPAAAVRLLAEFSGAPIDFDLEKFDLLRPSVGLTLNLSLTDTDVGGALNELANLLKWNVVVEKDRITLLPKEYDEVQVEERFDVADLLGDSSKQAPFEYREENEETPAGELSMEILQKMALSLVEPDSWQVNSAEGQGELSSDGTTLVVKQDTLNRKRVAGVLERLRALHGLEPKEEFPANTLIAETLGWERLKKKISFNLLKPITLQQALEILERSQKIQVLWDDAVLNDFGVGRDATTVARLDDASIDQVLTDLLEPHKLTYVILAENLFLITTKEHAENYKTVEIHMFSSEGKEVSAEEAGTLIEEMKTAVMQKSWGDPDVSLWIDMQSGCWIVRQSQPTQRMVRRWLDERR
ncbi:MAG: hypothetical protein PHO46_11720 [Thermoguttaceae bacterium]|nr:hypothetical protein [Thermoguttaceae bacterium]